MRKLILTFAVILASSLPVGQAARAAIDPFYTDLFQAAGREYGRGDFHGAERDFDLACFGMLDEPRQLGQCLVYLDLAQAQLGDRKAFLATFDRIAEVQQRFQGYTNADLPHEVRQAFESRITQWIPEAALAAGPIFRKIVLDRQVDTIAQLPPNDREAALAGQIARNPHDRTWRWMLARLYADEHKEKKAIDQLAALLADDPDDSDARCLRGRLEASGKSCQEAVVDLEACPARETDAGTAGDYLGCLVRMGSWEKARTFVATLTPDLAADPQVVALAQRIPAPPPPPAVEITAETTPGAAPAPPATVPPEPAPVPRGRKAKKRAARTEPEAAPVPEETPETPTTAALSASDRQRLAQAHRILDEATSLAQLEEAARLARQVADPNPGLRDAQLLAAEIAYRASHWKEAVRYFDRAGALSEDEPVLLFYKAVSLFESGDREGAAQALTRSLPRLEKTPYVQEYAAKILGPPQTGQGAPG